MIYDYLHREVEIDEKLCFVIMPFRDDLSNIYKEGIKPAVEKLGMRCERADYNIASDPILFQIFDEILKAKIIIADLTGANPNVYYELGICHALKRQVILLKQEGEEIPFDLAGIRQCEYSDRLGGEKQIQEVLESTIEELSHEPKIAIEARDAQKLLEKGIWGWNKSDEILLKYEEFLEVMLWRDELNLTDDEYAFLAYTAAYFGKFMKQLCVLAHDNAQAINVLIKEAATGSFTRVPWRAAYMLEHFNMNIVKNEIAQYKGFVANSGFYPDAIIEKATLQRLKETIDDKNNPKEDRDKLSQVLKQIRTEFGLQS
ncbi:MAG: nucleotide-binding protein [candidate division Zixibacteria bacterium]|nr:nucleotide-binding protein [candidate division Zixibacteria bacterium]